MNFKNKIILAPMAAVNNIAFRKLCSENGADIVYSQMIDGMAFSKGDRKLTDFYDEKNLIAQFFGNDAKVISECAKAVESKVRGVDLNLGCPHSDVVERKCGSYLMKYPEIIRKIIKGLVKNVGVPVTVKIRAGYDGKNINADCFFYDLRTNNYQCYTRNPDGDFFMVKGTDLVAMNPMRTANRLELIPK